MKNIILKNALINACATILYIMLISLFLFYGQRIIGANSEDVVLMPILMLSLLVFSASLVGIFIFARPVMWYLDGKRKEAIHLLTYTLGIFLVITIVILLTLFFIS